jgi:hypothetical protein
MRKPQELYEDGKTIVRGLCSVLRTGSEITEALAFGLIIFTGWYTPYRFRDQYHEVVIFTLYFAAAVVTLRALIMLVRYLRQAGNNRPYKKG